METSFGQLPNEILVYIFQELGRATLKAVRLLSNRLNALATPLLDKDVSINLRGRMVYCPPSMWLAFDVLSSFSYCSRRSNDGRRFAS